jgi:Ca2+-binding EF-hand superfamily protein
MKKFLAAFAMLAAFIVVAGELGADDKQAEAKQPGKFAADPEAIFKLMDANKDGKVTKEEFKKAADQFGQGGLADQIFTQLDTNKDDSLSLDEAKKFNGLGGQDKGKGKGKFDPAKLKDLQKKFGGKGKIDPEKLKDLQKKIGGKIDPAKIEDLLKKAGGKIDPEKLKDLFKKKGGEEEE